MTSFRSPKLLVEIAQNLQLTQTQVQLGTRMNWLNAKVKGQHHC